jgi:hypothetical protein
MKFQLTSLRYYQVAPATKQIRYIFIDNSKKMNFQPKIAFEKPFEHYDLAISEVSHYGFLRGHSSIS